MNIESDSPVKPQDSQNQTLASESLGNQGVTEPKIQFAYLHPPIRKTGIPYTGRYQVEFEGDLIVSDSRDPETDLARALLSRGITGMVKVMDADTKKHRTTVNIEKAAKLRTVEGPHGPRFVACQETYLDRPPAGETDLVGTPLRSRRIDHEDHQPPKPLILHASSGQQRDYLYGYELPIYAFCL